MTRQPTKENGKGHRRGQGRGEDPLSPRILSATEKQTKALKLRRKGHTWGQIAKRVGYGSKAAAYRGAMAAYRKAQLLPAIEYRAMELDRLDAALRAIWPKIKDGELRAIETMIKLQDRASRYLGLDQPPPREPDQPPAGTPVYALLQQIIINPERHRLAERFAVGLLQGGPGQDPLDTPHAGDGPVGGSVEARPAP